MRLRSCFSRYVRYLLCSCACSVLTFFINSNMLVNKSRIWIISAVLFLIYNIVDSYIFGRYFGKRRHIKYGIVYPYALFMLTTYIGHFAIKSARWRYFFLPFGIFCNYGFSRLLSMSIVHLATLVLLFVCTKIGQIGFYKNE